MEYCIHDSGDADAHHLIYREELKKDDEKKVLCKSCNEPIWGSLHNCVECCNRPVHRYPSNNNHCLDFTEKLENDGNKQVVCFMCNEPVLMGPAYKCFIPECSFFIHKSCAELSPEINHPLHPDHPLSLQLRRNKRCDACCTSHDRSFFYSCYSCDFQLDIKCANYHLPINPNDCHRHEFSLFQKRIQYNCEACGEEITNFDYKVCNICQLLVHHRCVEIPRTVKIKLHNHFLNLIYSTHEIKKRDDMFCRYCGKKVNTKYAAYYCHECSYILHTECLRSFRDKYRESHSPINPNDCHQHEFFPFWKRIQFNCEACGEEITNFNYRVCNICKLLVHYRCAEIPRTVKIELHNHFFNLIYSTQEIKKRDDIFCRYCGDKVNTEYAAYYCQEECSYILHTECLRSFWHKYGESPATSDQLVPNKSVGQATHLIKALNQAEDEGPHLGEIQHFSHDQQHKLILCNDEVNDDKLCEGCMEFIISIPFYSCAQCKFFLHTRCAELPIRIEQHRLHEFHMLTLIPQASNKSGVSFCDICSRHHRGFIYKCDTCWDEYNVVKTLDVQCGSIPETLKHEGHQHLFYLGMNSKNRECKACAKDNTDYVFVCTGCDFILGIRCANLPLVAKHKYDTHLLKLTYAAKQDSEEYYCLICEKERDQKHWFYYCEKCNFSAHPECVLGNYPCITIGSTYTSEYHPHPLTFVQKTEDSPKCHTCRDDLDDVALECSECKFIVHPPRPYFPDCLWSLVVVSELRERERESESEPE